MPYITREDGERFIIPSYRDVLSAKKTSLLRREIQLLSQNYGDYIALQRKNINQYEVAFSPDPGYLLGETVWHYFKRPLDLIYCEAIPNTFEAILVIVKAGVVYLDGSFPLDAIFDELVIFRTQQNNFEIYIHGDVPISETPEEGKFSLDRSSIKSFNVLPEPIFPILPIVKSFQLQLVETVLKGRGIGAIPLRNFVIGFIGLVLLVGGWYLLTSEKTPELQQVFIPISRPYQAYINALSSPDPAEQIRWIANNVISLSTLPGWTPDEYTYQNNLVSVSVKSLGARTDLLFSWAKANHSNVEVQTTGFFITLGTGFRTRPNPQTISDLDRVIAVLLDAISYILPGNTLEVSEATSREDYKERTVKINFEDITPSTLDLIGQQLRNLPLVLSKVSIKIDKGKLSGLILLKALGR